MKSVQLPMVPASEKAQIAENAKRRIFSTKTPPLVAVLIAQNGRHFFRASGQIVFDDQMREYS